VAADARPCVAVLASQIRMEEKLIFDALEKRRVPYERLDDRDLAFDLGCPPRRYAAVLNRSISQTRGLYAARILEAGGALVVNPSRVVEVCGDKLLTTLALTQAGVPTPRTTVALSSRAALAAIEAMGYPVVLKPVTGSWGRLLARVNDRDAAEALLEHREMLRSPQHCVAYIQEYIAKPGRDIRTIVVGDEVISAMYRQSGHWITNTARGAEPVLCPMTAELCALSLRAALAVGGGALAVDLLERPDGGLVVNEVNHTMEFHGTVAATGVDVAGRLVDYVLKVAGI